MARARTVECDDCYARRAGKCPKCERKARKTDPRYAARERRRSARRRVDNPDYAKNHVLKSRYGIDLSEKDQMATRQGGKCLICKSIPVKLVIDHCHTTGKIRGLLCSQCNSGLGMFKDSPELLEQAIKYLKL